MDNKEKFMTCNKDAVKLFASAIAAFSLSHRVSLEETIDIAIECIGDMIKTFIKDGRYDKAAKLSEFLDEILGED